MSVGFDTRQEKVEKGSQEKLGRGAHASRRGHGMRVGTLDDWRAGTAKASKGSADRSKRLRDGQ